MELKAETIKRVKAVIPKYPQRQSAMLPVLHLVQSDQGYLSKEAMTWVAEQLEVAPIKVYEVVSFYPFFREQPIGKKLIRVCRTLPCALVGAYKTCNVLQEELDCSLEGTSEDGEVTIQFAECLASCGSAPVVMVDNDLYEHVDEKKARELASWIKSDTLPGEGDYKKPVTVEQYNPPTSNGTLAVAGKATPSTKKKTVKKAVRKKVAKKKVAATPKKLVKIKPTAKKTPKKVVGKTVKKAAKKATKKAVKKAPAKAAGKVAKKASRKKVARTK